MLFNFIFRTSYVIFFKEGEVGADNFEITCNFLKDIRKLIRITIQKNII